MNYSLYLESLSGSGNLRALPRDRMADMMLDFSTNDYMGLACRADLRDRFVNSPRFKDALFTSSASRLLAATQNAYEELESLLATLYGNEALLFNSGYHVNSGLIPALCDKDTLILADKLVHASIIDGIMLSKCEFSRFRHNDMAHLERLIASKRPDGNNLLVIVESVYSMDGDLAPIEKLVELKRRYPGMLLYVDEAHALGVCGRQGLGLSMSCLAPQLVDVIVGTLGKAAASSGAFAIMSAQLKEVAVNRCRSLIFSTALPPVNAMWSTMMIRQLVAMDDERRHLGELSCILADALFEITGKRQHASHIQPLVLGDAAKALQLSRQLETEGVKVLPIRTPTVPPGTERLRISLSAKMTTDDVARLVSAIHKHYHS
ncbi:MAG: 8-amino-7-oxononanoate synthase [Clostridiales bacterium]|nr:8-amino-7-oxononanoate synthase [Clostridiales bacterium]